MAVSVWKDFAEVWIILCFALSLLGIVSRVFLALCIYNDARYRLDKLAAMWAALSGFSVVAAVVYLILRAGYRNRPAVCAFCGGMMAPAVLYCPQCGRMRRLNTPEQAEAFDRKRKLFLGIWIALAVLLAVLACAAAGEWILLISRFSLSAPLR